MNDLIPRTGLYEEVWKPQWQLDENSLGIRRGRLLVADGMLLLYLLLSLSIGVVLTGRHSLYTPSTFEFYFH